MAFGDVTKLVEEIGGTLINLAEVPPPKQAQFLEEVQDAVLNWFLNVLILGNIIPRESDRLLRQVFRNAEALHKQLSELKDAFLASASFEELTPATELLSYVCGKLDDELGDALKDLELKISRPTNLNITIVLLIVSRLLRAIAALENSQEPGINGYPGLDELVLRLGRAAYRADGKFTAHRKLGQKGSLIRALSEIKDRVADLDNKEIGEELAYALPARDQHPVSRYERLLGRARSSRRVHSHHAG